MMHIKGLILCEGASDQILISAYLGKEKGWEYIKSNFSRSFPFVDRNLAWYKNHQEEYLGIWQVGGNIFEPVIRKIMELEAKEHTVDSLAIVTDHDDVEAEKDRPKNIINVINENLHIIDFDENELVSKSNNKWARIEYKDSFLQSQYMDFCYLLVPIESQGALETYMLNALSEDSVAKKEAIQQVKKFIKEFKSDEFLTKRREKVKAELSVSISVFIPDRMFDTMTEIIKDVDWTDFKSTDTQFGKLLDI